MKNIIKYFGAVAFGCAMFSSCDNDEFLTVDQVDRVPGNFMWLNEENAKLGMNAIYNMNNPNQNGYDGDWGFKPNLFSGTHPTMDTQAGGWDANFTKQAWNATTTELNDGWKHAYHAIALANNYLEELEANKSVCSDKVYKSLKGEATCMRGFFYHYLATTWGRVPMLATGESFLTHPQKAKAETYAEMWDFLIEDFKTASELLEWQPMDGQKGRATKGMALAYLGDCYMWKAYRCPETADTSYGLAKAALKEVLTSGPYKLQDCYSTNWDCEGVWNDETIWVEVLNDCYDLSGWDDGTSRSMTKWFCAPTPNGGWGSLYLGWEWYASYEAGDKRRDASCVIGNIPTEDLKKLYVNANKENIAQLDALNAAETKLASLVAEQKSLNAKDESSLSATETTRKAELKALVPAARAAVDSIMPNHGKSPFLKEYIGETDNTVHFRFNGEVLPCCWTAKFWRNASANDGAGRNSWGCYLWSPTNVYWKRLPNVMLDYAECCFRTGEMAEGWKQLDALRERAFGNLEVGKDGGTYFGHLKSLVADYMTRNANDPAYELTDGKGVDCYPIPFNSETKTVKSAEAYYTEYAACNIKGQKFDAPVWQVAVNEERRKELNTEWSLRPDMQKSGFLGEHIAKTYPKYSNKGFDDPWSNREYDYDDRKNDMPIPADEIAKNPLCTQNEAYLAK